MTEKELERIDRLPLVERVEKRLELNLAVSKEDINELISRDKVLRFNSFNFYLSNRVLIIEFMGNIPLEVMASFKEYLKDSFDVPILTFVG